MNRGSCMVIMEDWSNEHSGFFRAYSAESPDAQNVCTLFGYSSAGHSFRTIRQAVSDARRVDTKSDIYRAFHSGAKSRLIERGTPDECRASVYDECAMKGKRK